MSDGTDFDDSNPAIVYSSGWQAETGTISQQFDNTVHQTTVNGASATIKFSGTRITVFQTVPGGNGAPESVDINFDGDTSTMSRITRPGEAFYQDRWFDSGPLTNGVHLLILTNSGGDGGTPFILDRVNVEGSLIGPGGQLGPTTTTTTSTSKAPAPSPPPPPSANPNTPSTTTSANSNSPSATTTSQGSGPGTVSSPTTPGDASSPQSPPLTSNPDSGSTPTSRTLESPSPSSTIQTDSATTAATSSVQTVVSVQYITNANGSVSTIITTPSSLSNANSTNALHTSNGLPLGAILGIVLGSLIVILVFLLLLLCLRRRRKTTRLADTESKTAERHSPTDVSPFLLNSQDSSGSPTEHSNVQDMAGIARKLRNDTITTITTRQESIPGSVSPPSSNQGRSEKSSDPFSAEDESTSTTALAGPSNTANRTPEADAGPLRPNHLVGDTILYGPAGRVYALISSPSDTNTNGPPPYQSASQRDSAA